MNCVTELFILEAKQQRKSGLHVDWDNQSVSVIVTKLEQKKNDMGLSLWILDQKVSGSYVTCSKFPTNQWKYWE